MTIAAPDPAHSLRPSGNLHRRLAISRVVQGLAVAAAALAVGVLLLLVGVTVSKGVSILSWHFLTGELPVQAGGLGGIGPALAGTAEISLIAGVISVPVGVMTALFVSEFASSRVSAAVVLVLELLAGLPAIVVGVFIFAVLVEHDNTSGLAGALALSLIMAPLIARSSMESLARVPSSWRDAAEALGISRWRTVVGLVVPAASSGITTAAILAVARAGGDAAPLLFTTEGFGNNLNLNPLKPMANLPVVILTQVEEGFPNSIAIAWGGAFLLMVVILCVNIGSRIMLSRGERKRGL